MAGIFISYRRSEASGWAGHLLDTLRTHLGRTSIFRDIDSIPPGVDFEAYIRDAVGSCDVLLALIGPQWLTASHGDDDLPRSQGTGNVPEIRFSLPPRHRGPARAEGK